MLRRTLLASGLTSSLVSGLVFGTAGMALAGCTSTRSRQAADHVLDTRELAALEARNGGRLGLHMLDTATGFEAGWRSQERFAMCSTFKTLLVAHVLNEAQNGQLDLARNYVYQSADLVDWSPITEKHAGQGMSLQQLCEAAITVSDNTAANLLLNVSGGPAGLTGWMTELGDNVTRLDRNEPTLNTAIAGDERDTTTPAAMLRTLQKLLLGKVLPDTGRTMLQQWLLASRTGDKRLRAGMPASWKMGGKTGSGDNGTANDTLLIWPTPDAAPLLVTAFFTRNTLQPVERDAVLAKAGEVVSRWYLGS